MSMEEIEERQAHFKEFGEILVRRHGQNYYSSYDNQNRVTIDETAVRFGRYLRAARSNADLSIKELSIQTKISEATLMALEQGLILACDIKPRWLKRLAQTLTENIEDFNLLLGRKYANDFNNSLWFTERWLVQCQNFLTYYGKTLLLSKPIYGAVTVILLCFAVSTFFFLGVNYVEKPPPKQETNSHVIVAPKSRPDLFRADPGIEGQVIVESAQAHSLPTQVYNSSGIARRY